MPVTKDEFRRVMGFFATGVTVVTSRIGERLYAMTANAVTSVSLEPLLLLVCVDKTAFTHKAMEESRVFAVCILAEDQEQLSRRFAAKPQPGENFFEGVDYKIGSMNCPLLDGCLAYLECRVHAIYPAGDHTIFVGEVIEASVEDEGYPLLFYRSHYHSMAR